MSSTETEAAAVSATQPPFINLSAYRFTPLDNLPGLKDQLRTLTLALGMRGTILLSPEGINLFVAGTRDSHSTACSAALRAIPGLADLDAEVQRERPTSRSTACSCDQEGDHRVRRRGHRSARRHTSPKLPAAQTQGMAR
jgi:predicted sulfurtransferase